MKKKVLYLMAPNDRFNYGDLLFSHIIRHYLGDLFDEVIDVSTTCSDLSDKGGFPTKRYDVLYSVDNNKDNYFIAAGGDSLGIGWQVILSFVDSNIARLSCYIVMINKLHVVNIIKLTLKSIVRLIIKFYIKVKYPHKTTYVFTPGKNELTHFSKIFYNSLSCSAFYNKKNSVERNKKSTKIFKSVDYIAVRDKITQDGLRRLGIDSILVADSAILMNKVFDCNLLDKQISMLHLNRYIFFQVNEHIYKENRMILINTIKNILLKTDFQICLCPIGVALHHGDNIALLDIYKQIEDDRLIFIDNVNIWNIMGLIKNSNLYVGSSLHGAITAMSFEVPLVCYGPIKLFDYIKTWTNLQDSLFSEINNLESTILKQLKNKIIIDKKLQETSILNSFKRMQELIIYS